MKNILKLSAVVAVSLISAQSMAVDGTGTANFTLVTPITVTEATQMEFGDINLADGTCTLDYADAVSGANCAGTGAAPTSGSFNITAADGTVNLAVSGADTTIPGVTFTPTLAATSGTVAGGSLNVKVGGSVAVVAASATAGAKSLNYTLSVTY